MHRKLQASRAALLSKLDDLSECDRGRPMTPTGMNLLGLVKYLAGLEYGYLGESFGYPVPDSMSWVEDGSIWQCAAVWAKPDESSEYWATPVSTGAPAPCRRRHNKQIPTCPRLRRLVAVDWPCSVASLPPGASRRVGLKATRPPRVRPGTAAFAPPS